MVLNVLSCQLTYQGQAETNVEAWFNIALGPWKPEGPLGQTAQDGHLDSHTASVFLLYSFHVNTKIIRKGCSFQNDIISKIPKMQLKT